MNLKILKEEFSICKIETKEQIPFEDNYVFAAKTEEEFSLVCQTKHVPEKTLACESGWRALKIEGILDFSLIGILSGISSVLAEHKIGIFVVSTYNTDYILLKQENLAKGCSVLREKNYHIK